MPIFGFREGTSGFKGSISFSASKSGERVDIESILPLVSLFISLAILTMH